MNAIFIHNLTKTYKTGTKALAGIDLTVEKGDFFALLGVNGAGKTTTIGILTGLVEKTSGTVSVFGDDLDTAINKVKQHIGVVPQEFNFNIFEKVIDIVVAQAGYYGISRAVAIARAETILKRLELWEKKDTAAMQLSGGMKRRLMIARALIHEPRLLILDEPTAGVDVELRRGMWEYLQELNAGGTTILLTTHYLEEVEQLCSNAAVMNNGEIILNDSVKNLMRSVERESYTAIISEAVSAESLAAFTEFEMSLADAHTLEFTIDKGQSITDVVQMLAQKNIAVASLRPKLNRMEQLFLHAVQ